MAFGNLKFDTLTTSDSKNTNTEKSLDTSYIFNGVAKHWMSATEPGSVGDSFNLSSTSDGGTGLNTLNVSSAFSNVKASVPNMTNHDDSYNRGTTVDDASVILFISGNIPSCVFILDAYSMGFLNQDTFTITIPSTSHASSINAEKSPTPSTHSLENTRRPV